MTATAQPANSTQQVGVVNPYNIQGAQPLDQELATGDFVSNSVGVRIATPFFGTGFNLCTGERALLQTCFPSWCGSLGDMLWLL